METAQHPSDNATRHGQSRARNHSLATFVGAPMVGILLLAMAAMAWWLSFTHNRAYSKARTREIETVGAIISQSAEVMLAADELSALRRLAVEAAREYDLTLCRVVLPNGQIVADADPSRITIQSLPPRWSATVMDASGSPIGDGVCRTYALSVIGRGPARLEVAAGVQPSPDQWDQELGVGAIVGAALILLLLFCGRVRARLRGIGEVRAALLSFGKGESSLGALAVDGGLGPEAVAWNKLLTQYGDYHKEVTLVKARTAIASSRSAQPGLDSACDAMPQGIILLDQSLCVRYCNGAAAKFLGAKREEITGSEVGRFIGEGVVLDAARTVSKGMACGRTVAEVKDAHGEGVLRYVVRPVRREDCAAAMIIIDDITQQRVAEESRNAFVAQATHELRTPLTNIRLYLETLQGEGETDPVVRAQSLNVINQETLRLERLVRDILSITEIEAGAYKLKKDDISTTVLFQELQSDYKAQADKRGVNLVFDLPPKLPVLTGDRDKVALALHNLVGNALKYTPSGGQVMVSAEVGEKELTVEVSDTGIGISEEDAKNLFKKFQRAKDPRVAGIPGSGLGLALAREVIRLHGGDILLKSELNKGSTFTVVLPVRSEAA